VTKRNLEINQTKTAVKADEMKVDEAQFQAKE
jgi:hypothetical protein